MFRLPVKTLRERGHEVVYAVKAKDILLDLIADDETEKIVVAESPRGSGKGAVVTHLLKREWALFKVLCSRRFDLMIGTEPSIAHMGFVFRIPSIITGDDDLHVIPLMAKIAFPFASHVLAPDSCDLGKWSRIKIEYPGYQKLTYLHPACFRPDQNKVARLQRDERPYFLLRFSSLQAHHDTGVGGITDDLVEKIIERLKPHGNVYISSERPIAAHLEPYRLQLPIKDIHHALYFAEMLIGDSQSMTVEAALLGTPSLRFSDFSGEIGVLEELEHKYGLTFGFKPKNPNGLLQKLDELLETKDTREVMESRRKAMLKEKIDVTKFWVWLFENYPQGIKKLDEGLALARG